jgi:hypothetical protein
MSGAPPHRGALDMGRGHDAIACDPGGGDLRPAWSRQKQVSRNTNCVTTTTFSAGDAADVTFSETRSGLAGPVRVLREPFLITDQE